MEGRVGAGAGGRAPARRVGMRKSLTVVLLALVAATVLAACSKKGGYDFPPPPSTIPNEQTTVPDYSSVQLAAVPGRCVEKRNLVL